VTNISYLHNYNITHKKQQVTTNWSDDELLAYILIYCSSADLTISTEEKEYLTTKFSKAIYDKMLAIFHEDAEEVRVAKIKDAYDDHIYNNDETDIIYEEMHNIFNIDGDFDELEKNVLKKMDQILA